MSRSNLGSLEAHVTFAAKYIAEDTAGHGQVLGFPKVSTCVAVVVRLPAELVGWHVTMHTLQDIETNHKGSAARGAAKFIEYAAGATGTDKLYIVGHVGKHDPGAIRDWVNGRIGAVLPTSTFDISAHGKAKHDGEYHIFFESAGAGDPLVRFKKSSKTAETIVHGSGDMNPPTGDADLAKGYLPVHDRTADFSASNLHRLRKYFVDLP